MKSTFSVFLIDDKAFYRDSLREILLKNEQISDVYCSKSDDEYLSVLKANQPDIVLVSFDKLTNEAEIQLLKNIHQNNPRQNIAVIVGVGQQLDSESLAKFGVNALIHQHDDIEDLIQEICLAAKGKIVISGPENLDNQILDVINSAGSTALPVFAELSDREKEILQLIVNGATNQEIAEKLFLSDNTVKVHVQNLLGKLNVRNRQQAVALAVDNGMKPDLIDYES